MTNKRLFSNRRKDVDFNAFGVCIRIAHLLLLKKMRMILLQLNRILFGSMNAVTSLSCTRAMSQARSPVVSLGLFHETRSAANLARKILTGAHAVTWPRLLTCINPGKLRAHVPHKNENLSGTCLLANLFGRFFQLLLQHGPCCA